MVVSVIPLRAVYFKIYRGPSRAGLERFARRRCPTASLIRHTKFSSGRQGVPLASILDGVLYSWCYGYAHTSVSRALLYAPWQTLGKPYINQNLGKPYIIPSVPRAEFS